MWGSVSALGKLSWWSRSWRVPGSKHERDFSISHILPGIAGILSSDRLKSILCNCITFCTAIWNVRVDWTLFWSQYFKNKYEWWGDGVYVRMVDVILCTSNPTVKTDNSNFWVELFIIKTNFVQITALGNQSKLQLWHFWNFLGNNY